MMHGVIYSTYGYTPLLSEVALCWGGDQVQQMIELGVEPDRLLITGCQRLAKETRVASADIRDRLGLPAETPIVMLATGPMSKEERRRLVFAFGDAFPDATRACPVVRLHASEKLADFTAEISRYPQVRFLENQKWSVEEAMAACDAVVIHNSGLGNDALVFSRLVVLLDVLATPLSNGRVLAEKAGSPVARSPAELREIVDRILADGEYRHDLQARAEAYVHGFCAAFGRDAARNVAAEVMRMTRSASPRTTTAAVP